MWLVRLMVLVCTLTELSMRNSVTSDFKFNVQNMEAEKQVKFFQGCMATAFAERDQAIIEVTILSVFLKEYRF